MVMADLIQAARERPAIAVVVVAAAVPVLVGGGLLTSILLAPFLPFLVVALVRHSDTSCQLPIAEQTSSHQFAIAANRIAQIRPHRLSDSCHQIFGIFSFNLHKRIIPKIILRGLVHFGATSIYL